MRYAIVVGYMADQNEPSRPDADLLAIPDDPGTRKQMLFDKFQTKFYEDDPECFDDNSVVYREHDDGRFHWGDIVLSDDTFDLFITYVTNLDDCR